MADFDPPFGNDAEKRLPTTDERQNGFPCGPADQRLFNGLFHRIESEVGEVISFAGLTPTDTRFTQLREAIQALIAAATGGGSPDDYLLLSQARARLPIFPEIQSADNRIIVSSPAAGTVRLPGGVTFLHRGILPVTTVQTDFSTVASAIYHLRWYAPGIGRASPAATYPGGRYFLELVGDFEYNPTSASDTDRRFDSTFDSMLIARVITNSSNVATITNLANAVRLVGEASRAASVGDGGTLGVVTPFTFNFARTPFAMLESTNPPGGQRDSDLWIQVEGLSRYGMSVRSWNWTQDYTVSGHNSPGYKYNLLAV